MIIASFDIGIFNFATCVAKNNTLLFLKKYTLQSKDVALTLLYFMDTYKNIWNTCDTFLIEQQHGCNNEARRVSNYLEMYLKTCYGSFKTIIKFPSIYKTKVFSTIKMSKKQRKQFCIIKARDLLKHFYKSNVFLNIFEMEIKKDDLADCICQLHAYKIKNNV
ncbi:hypothetical protein AGMMS49579_03760 [Spirochaetia bacterium]|nr:hypothetical protein AGMMS49579_03760 [Spirochaetia bacterium]